MLRPSLVSALIVLASPFAHAQSPSDFGVTTLTPPVLKTDPGPRYWPRLRIWQGVPGIERAANGRLWATWYAGPLAEGSEGNYAVLVTSGDDGKTWSKPVAVYDPGTFFGGNTGDPHLWIDPGGRLWWFVNRVMKVNDPNGIRSVWGFPAANPGDPLPRWEPPVFAGYGIGLNKPTALANGDWLRPVDTFDPKDPDRAQFWVSRDRGKSFARHSKLAIKNVSFSEHMAAERKDGSLLLLARTTYGVAQAESADGGKSWAGERPLTRERGVNTRFFLKSLRSGALLLVVNDAPRGRTNLTAMLSEDGGRTWPHGLLLDDRQSVSYPDGTEGDGFAYVAYDRGRYARGQQEILFAKFTEADVRAGKLVTEGSKLRQVIDRLADAGGGVSKDREPQALLDEFRRSTEAPRKRP